MPVSYEHSLMNVWFNKKNIRFIKLHALLEIAVYKAPTA